MKRFAIAFAIAAVALVTSDNAHAVCDDTASSFAWDGGGADNKLTTVNNWTADSEYPGFDGASPGDSITIANNTRTTCELDATLCDIDTLTLDADTAQASMAFNIIANGSVATGGLVTVKGRQTGQYSRTATLKVVPDYGLEPYTMKLWGRDDATLGHAIFDVDGKVCVADSNGGTVDLTVDGFGEVRIADGKWFYAGDVTLNDSSVVLDVTGDAGATTMPEFLLDGDGFTFASAKVVLHGPVMMKHQSGPPEACP